MKLFAVLTICILLWSCANPIESEIQEGFPDVALTSGKDADYSFKSITTQRQEDGALEVRISGWSIEEYGLFLWTKTENRILELNIMGECGTVSSHTQVKKTFDYLIEPAEEDSLAQIHYNHFVITK